MKTYYTFKNVRNFDRFLRTKTYNSGELDFTMHEYDAEGKYMSWANKKHDTIIECENRDRYMDMRDTKLSKITKYGFLRDDISYFE